MTETTTAVTAGDARWFNNWSFRTQLIAGVCGLVLFTGLMVIWLGHRQTRATTALLVDSLFSEVSGHTATQARCFVLRAAPLTDTLSLLVNHGLTLEQPEPLARQLLAFLQANQGMSWVSYGDAQGSFVGAQRTPEGALRVNISHIEEGQTRLVEHDVLPNGEWREYSRNPDSGYDPRTRPFYLAAAAGNDRVWLPPYVFFKQGIPGISCAAPVRAADGQLRGVLSVDFDFQALSDFIGKLQVSEHSRILLFTADGQLLADSQPLQATLTSQELTQLSQAADPLLRAFHQYLPRATAQRSDAADEYEFFAFQNGGGRQLASARRFQVDGDLDWVVGVVAPESDFLGDVWKTQTWALLFAVAVLLLALALAAAMARYVSKPVQALIAFMQRVGGGDLEAKANFGGSQEFRRLAAALNQMIADLRDRVRLRHSLDVAMEVQQRLLPQEPPRVPGLDVAGHSTYCDETGGDYYDFLVVDQASPDSLLIALGDVMGHGIAAALVMAGARAVLRDRANTSGSLADLLGRLNRTLASDLDGSRFMTMLLLVIDARTRNMRCVSAGHDPALIYSPQTNTFDEVDASDLPLGIMDDTEYEERPYGPLEDGQVLALGTDGVWEMPDNSGELFGKDRLRDVIRASATGTAEQIVDAIVNELRVFRGDCKQVDDVTFVIIKIGPRE